MGEKESNSDWPLAAIIIVIVLSLTALVIAGYEKIALGVVMVVFAFLMMGLM